MYDFKTFDFVALTSISFGFAIDSKLQYVLLIAAAQICTRLDSCRISQQRHTCSYVYIIYANLVDAQAKTFVERGEEGTTYTRNINYTEETSTRTTR